MDIFSILAIIAVVASVAGVGTSYMAHQSQEAKRGQWQIGTLAMFGFNDHQSQEAKRGQWQSLAAAKKLTFTPGTWAFLGSTSASVQGKYKDCYLTLVTVEKIQGGSSDTYTQLSVRPEQRVTGKVDLDKFPLGQPLAYYDLKTWLNGQSPLYYGNKFPLEIEDGGLGFVYEQYEILTDNSALEGLFDFLAELTRTYPEVVSLGGDAVPALEQIASESSEQLQPIAQQLLRDIATDTRRLKLDSDQSFCPRCLTYCASYELRLGWWNSLTFYGCRNCRQSREFLQGSLIAVLDSQDETELTRQQDNFLVNWLQRRNLFDFRRVEIVQATDEEVEHFAVQVGNDTDEWRKPLYEQMPCVVSAQCQLSENTLRILERMFGEVKVETL